jgi:hypothetical protein
MAGSIVGKVQEHPDCYLFTVRVDKPVKIVKVPAEVVDGKVVTPASEKQEVQSYSPSQVFETGAYTCRQQCEKECNKETQQERIAEASKAVAGAVEFEKV